MPQSSRLYLIKKTREYDQSCLFSLLAAEQNSDNGAAKAEFHMMQKLWNASQENNQPTPLLHIDGGLAGAWGGLGKAPRLIMWMSKAHLSASSGPVDLGWHKDWRGGEIKKQVLGATTHNGLIAHHQSGRMCAGMCHSSCLCGRFHGAGMFIQWTC